MATRKKGAQSKSEFVRSLPADLPAKDVVEKAKAAGISLTDKYVYNVRNLDRARGKTIAKPTKRRARRATRAIRRGRPPSTRQATASANGSTDSQFIQLALDIGLARASDLLDRLRERLKSVVLT